MSEMVERAARAIRRGADSHAMARAAIEEMRCPPKNVLDAGYAVLNSGGAMFDAWNAMVDVALKG